LNASRILVLAAQVGNYRLVAQLGEGGMGAVYRAEHTVTGRRAAVKILRPELARDPEFVRRFVNEARAATHVGHPGIVDVIDVGTTTGGLPYLLMEFLDGETLGARLARSGRLRVNDAVSIAHQTAAAVGAAHARGIVHRDLKPENLFLVPDPERPGVERVKVLDFGIAKLRPQPGLSAVRTHQGLVIGTPLYMSPEQCRPTAEREVDARTDIYALGCILFEMLCGAPPFATADGAKVMLRHLGEQPPLPSALNPGVPEHLEAAILRALAKDRDDRFGSMAELQAAMLEGPNRTVADAVPASARLALPDKTVVLEAQSSAPAAASYTPVAAGKTTLSRATGATEAVPPGRRRWVLLGGIAAAAVAAIGIVTMGRRPAIAPAPAAALEHVARVPAAASPAPVPVLPPSTPSPAPAVVEPPAPEPGPPPKPMARPRRARPRAGAVDAAANGQPMITAPADPAPAANPAPSAKAPPRIKFEEF
jgi:tRNA A-37 threonylcarbamoyl transferase component Bud32